MHRTPATPNGLLTLAVSLILVAMLAACGSDATPTTYTPDSNEPLPVTPQTATPDGSSNATAGPGSTSTPVSGSTEQFRPEIQEFLDASCSFEPDYSETWGELANVLQSIIEHVEGLRTPGELRAVVEASLAMQRYQLDWARGHDPNEEINFGELDAFAETDEAKALLEALTREGEALEPGIFDAMSEC